jgi:outer membrane protein
MKNLIALIAVIIIAVSCGNKSKIGYYNSQEVLKENSVVKDADSTVAEYIKTLENGFVAAKQEYELKLSNYKSDSASLSPASRQVIVNDLIALEQRIAAYPQEANEKLQQKREEIYRPILDKLNKVVEKIAKQHGYDYIFEVSNLKFAYSNKENDLTEEVKKRFAVSDEK